MVSHHVVPQFWLSRAWPGGSSSFHPSAASQKLGASISLEILLWFAAERVCSLLCRVHEEIVDVAFSIGAKAHNIFLVVHYLISQQEASHMCCRALAWLAIACIRA